jgi:Zn-dependent M28 family amino/carboxypeptidase
MEYLKRSAGLRFFVTAGAFLFCFSALAIYSQSTSEQQRAGQNTGQQVQRNRGDAQAGQQRQRRQRPPAISTVPRAERPMTPAQLLVDKLDLERFKKNIKDLADFGNRVQGSESNIKGGNWLEEQLKAYGYEVERLTYDFRGEKRDNIYATKVGAVHPEEMYLVTAHYDGLGRSGAAANDNGSGCSLVLEAARVFAGKDVVTDRSIRFVFWNNEETGLNGAKAYVEQRRELQGKENPPGSGKYPEPKWLGLINQDMILFDHGLPVGEEQSPNADIDIEYKATFSYGGRAIELAAKLLAANAKYSPDYPADVGLFMSNTDSDAFKDECPAVSVRENERLAEIGNGADPTWHQPSDLYETFSEKDFLLGFNAVQMEVGAVAELVNAKMPGKSR